MYKAFSIIKKNENILCLTKDKLALLHLKELTLEKFIFFKEPSNNQIISYIIIDKIADLSNLNLLLISFTNKITLIIKKYNLLTSSFLTIKYLQEELGYVKTLQEDKYAKFRIVSFIRKKIKILYISDKEDERIIKIDKYLSNYSKMKKYNYIRVIKAEFSDYINRLQYIKKEIIDTEYLLVIYKYSTIIDWTFNIEKFITVNSLEKYIISIDDKNSVMFDNFLIKNCNKTIDIIDEILLSINKNYLDKYMYDNRTLIYKNNLGEIFNIEKNYKSICQTYEFIINLNYLNNKSFDIDIDIILNYYLNIYNEYSNISYFSLYLKEYSWGLMNKGIMGAIKFKFKNKLEYLEGQGIYKSITNHTYNLEFGNYNLNITFYDKYNKFIGYDINTNAEVIGFLNN